jgi:hypothetical protein
MLEKMITNIERLLTGSYRFSDLHAWKSGESCWLYYDYTLAYREVLKTHLVAGEGRGRTHKKL